MLIVFGWKVVFKVVGSGVFSCPNCGADRNYERRRAQKFFTLFFIPIIPLKVIGEIVRCNYCKNDFRDTVLQRPTSGQVGDLLQNTVRGVMVNVLRVGGWNHPAARAAALQEIALAGVTGYFDANLDQDMQVVPQDMSQLLAALASQLAQPAREALVAGATRVAAADGPVQPAERQLVDSFGAALGMTAAHVAGVVNSVAPTAPVPPQYAPQQPLGATSVDAVPPQYAAQAPVQDAVPPQYQAQQQYAPQPQAPMQDAASMETMLVPPQRPPAPVQDAASMETMALPFGQMPPQGPVDPSSQPTHVRHVGPNEQNYPQQ